MRNVIGTDKGNYLVYADWKSQEAAIQGALSNDGNIKAALKAVVSIKVPLSRFQLTEKVIFWSCFYL